jgi:hypothetical protein
MNEHDLRSMLEAEAESFRLDPSWAIRAATHRTSPSRRLISVVAVAAVVAGCIALFWETQGPSRSDPIQQNPVLLRLVGYQAPRGGEIPDALRRHLSCMRHHGFAFPDPDWSGDGWTIEIDDPAALRIGSPEWKRTAFGTCALVRDRGTYERWIRDSIMRPRPRH